MQNVEKMCRNWFDGKNVQEMRRKMCKNVQKCAKKGKRGAKKRAKNDIAACIICRKIPKKYMTYNCGHSIVCVACNENIPKKNGKKLCPKCGEVVTTAIPTIPR